MTTTAQRPATRPQRGEPAPFFLARAAGVGCAILLASAALARPVAATDGESPAPGGSASPTASEAVNQAPRLMTCGGMMTQSGATESMRVNVADPDGDPVTLSARASMFGVQPTVSGHVITYQAPTRRTGQDNFVVLASDGRGGEAHCEIAVLVQAGSVSPAPTPAATTPSPSATAPELTTAAPTPTPVPRHTSDTPVPGDAPTPTPRPASPAASTVPAAPGGEVDDETTTASGTASRARGTGSGEDSGAETPGAPAGGAGGADGAAPGTGTGGAQGPDDGSAITLPPRPVPDGAGGAPDAGGPITDDPEAAPSGPGEVRQAEAGRADVERLADTGASGWLFAVVGVLMIALVGLALMALPRGRRQH